MAAQPLRPTAMPRPQFITLDGPKGTGKTTLLEALAQALRAEGHKVVRLCERKRDPFRQATMALVNELARHPDPQRERALCARMADSRAWISQHVLPEQPADSLVLMDRWYPSDAAFRRDVPFDDILRMNLERQVQVPDLHIGVVTAPEISWARAAARRRGLGSTVLFTLEQQAASTQAFERAAAAQNWLLCRNEGTVEAAVAALKAQVQARLVL